MTRFSVNLNKIALLRNSRGANNPSVLEFAQRCMNAGVHGLTVHPRPDERHIRRSDVRALSDFLQDYPNCEFNIEGNPTDDFLALVCETKPHQCTLVPDSPEQVTSDHGWDAVNDGECLLPIVKRLHAKNIRVAVFMHPDPIQIRSLSHSGADRVELYTEEYAKTFHQAHNALVLERYELAARVAQEVGFGVNAGHDLNLDNLGRFLTIPSVLEVSIGHAILIEAMDYGYNETLKRYLAICAESEHH
ncbi:MAG: pyridoxine 5'-phosphate synthase [Arenicellales bacterium WSBS_2016_MAG_OTU3]